MKFSRNITAALFSCILAISAAHAETLPTKLPSAPDSATSVTAVSYFVEISIGRNMLTLYEKNGAAEKTPVAEYTVGTAVRGLKTYPLSNRDLLQPLVVSHSLLTTSVPCTGDRASRGGPARRPAELHGTIQNIPVTPDK